jgi:uncharacterized protein YdhG (YjbR/CyaY superfamily)
MDKPTVDSYIGRFEGITRERLEQLRAIVKPLLPDAEEKISYQIPAYYKKGYIVYFAGYDGFVSMYPVHTVATEIGDELAPYISGKATVRFPHSKPLPDELIKKIVLMLAEKNNLRNKK